MSGNGQKINTELIKREVENLKKLISSNQFSFAEKEAKKLLVNFPESLDLLNLLGVSLVAQNKLDEAEKNFIKITEVKPDFAEAYNNLGNIYLKQNKTDKAIEFLERSISKRPDLIQAHFNLAKIYTNLGNHLQTQGKFKESIINYKKSIKYKKDDVETHNNLGVAQINLNKVNEAIINFRKAIEIKSDYFEAHNNLGNVLSSQEEMEESIKSYREAIKINPSYVEAYSNLGAALDKFGKFNEAIDHYKKAIKLKPNFVKAYNNMAASFTRQGKFEDAAENYNIAFKLEPERTEYVINANLLIPTIPRSNEDIKFWREKFISSIESLKKYKYSIDDPQKKINPPTFNLAYSDYNNLEIMKKISAFFRNVIPIINYKMEKKNIDKLKNKKIRIGFISEFLTDHTIGRLFRGLIKKIDRNKFDVFIFHTSNTKLGEIKNEIDNNANNVIHLNEEIKVQQKQIEKESLDIIFYTDIGMSSSTYFLAHARLAPIQITTLGHPDTSGIDTIDYFLSSSYIESENSNSFYSEKLVCIDPVFMNLLPPEKPKIKFKRSDFGLSNEKNIYCCPQTLFKIHPKFDEALAKILEKDVNGIIVMIETKYKTHVEKLKERWSKNFSILNEKVIFIKNMPQEKFLSLINISDVLLDPFYFSGGFSFTQTLISGTPTVTMPTTFMRSQVTAGLYKQMKILNAPIAKNMDEYIDFATKLGKDETKNLNLRKSIQNAAELHLFNDLKSVKQFEKFLQETFDAAIVNSHLADGYIVK